MCLGEVLQTGSRPVANSGYGTPCGTAQQTTFGTPRSQAESSGSSTSLDAGSEDEENHCIRS